MVENLENFVLNQYEFNGDAVAVHSLGSAFLAISKHVNEYKVTGLLQGPKVRYYMPDESPLALMNAVINYDGEIKVYEKAETELFKEKCECVYVSQKDILSLKPNPTEDDIFYIGNAYYKDVNLEAVKYYDHFVVEYKHGAIILSPDIEQAFQIRAIVGNGVRETQEGVEFYYNGYDFKMNNVSAAAILDVLTYEKPAMIKSYKRLEEILKEEAVV